MENARVILVGIVVLDCVVGGIIWGVWLYGEGAQIKKEVAR